MITRETITGVILAAGQGRRMSEDGQGSAKASQPFRGARLIDHVIARFSPQVGHLLLSVDPSKDDLPAGLPRVHDRMPDSAGPLAGIQAALGAADTRWLAAVPCDTPFLPRDLVWQLALALEARPDADLALARGPRHRHPLCLLARTTLAPVLDAYLAEGHRAVEGWADRCRRVWVAFDDEAPFTNLNTLDELRAHDAR